MHPCCTFRHPPETRSGTVWDPLSRETHFEEVEMCSLSKSTGAAGKDLGGATRMTPSVRHGLRVGLQRQIVRIEILRSCLSPGWLSVPGFENCLPGTSVDPR